MNIKQRIFLLCLIGILFLSSYINAEDNSSIQTVLVSNDSIFILGETFKHLLKENNQYKCIFEKYFFNALGDYGIVYHKKNVYFCARSEGLLKYSVESKKITSILTINDINRIIFDFYGKSEMKNLAEPTDLCLIGNYLYIMNFGSGHIIGYNLMTQKAKYIELGEKWSKEIRKPFFSKDFPFFSSFSMDGRFFFFSCFWTNSIMIVDSKKETIEYIQDPKIKKTIFVECHLGELYFCNIGSSNFYVYNLKDKTIRDFNFKSAIVLVGDENFNEKEIEVLTVSFSNDYIYIVINENTILMMNLKLSQNSEPEKSD